MKKGKKENEGRKINRGKIKEGKKKRGGKKI